MLMLWKRCIKSPKGEVIRGHGIWVVSIQFIVGHVSNVIVLKVGTLIIILISSRVSWVVPFRPHFRLAMEVILVSVVILARVVSVFEGFVFWLFYLWWLF